MRFCRLRAMHHPELFADEPRLVFWTVRRPGLQHGAPIHGRPGGAGESDSRATSNWEGGKWVGCRAR